MTSMRGSVGGMLVVLAALIGGCVNNSTPDVAGPTVLRTPAFTLDDNLGDAAFRAELVEALNEVRGELEAIVPPDPEADVMTVHLFETRTKMANWADAEEISGFEIVDRGGMSGDFGVAIYYVGAPDTLRLARHEYVHQYLKLNARKRLPPFVEEGFATMFDGGADGARLESLAGLKSVRPVSELIATHANQLGNKSMAERTAWYAQAWAFAEFIDARYPTFWQTYFARSGGFAALLTESAQTDWSGIEARYAEFVAEELLK